jgi:hypothetical protein
VSAGVLLLGLRVRSVLLLGHSCAKAHFRLLVDPLELTETHPAGEASPEGLRLIQLITLAGVFSLRSQIVQVFD